jgi:DNA repair protein RadC
MVGPSRPRILAHVREGPRERLRDRGHRALSARELLTLLVGSGGPERSAVEVAEGILGRFGSSLRALSRADPATLEGMPGVGPATAARIVAALELGRRAAAEGEAGRDGSIQGPEDVHARLGPRLRDLPQEEFHALLLDVRHRVVREVLVTRGTLDASLIHPREVFRLAIVESAAAVILAHNHPSGDPTPSPEDRAVTRQLADAGRAVGIPVLDHVVVGDGRFVSLARNGTL